MKIPAHLKPNSRHREEVVVGSDGTYIIYTKAPAIEGRANAAAIKLLAQYFGEPQSGVRLVCGARAKHKVFLIDI